MVHTKKKLLLASPETIAKPNQPKAFQAALASAWERWVELQDKKENKEVAPRKSNLLIEDDKIVQLVHTRMLSNFNCLVDTAETENQALKMYQNNNYDIIFVDVGLPDIPGYTVIERIRKGSGTLQPVKFH